VIYNCHNYSFYPHFLTTKFWCGIYIWSMRAVPCDVQCVCTALGGTVSHASTKPKRRLPYLKLCAEVYSPKSIGICQDAVDVLPFDHCWGLWGQWRRQVCEFYTVKVFLSHLLDEPDDFHIHTTQTSRQYAAFARPKGSFVMLVASLSLWRARLCHVC